MKGKIFFGDGSYGYVIATKDSEIDGKDVIIILIKLDPYFSKKHNLKRFNDKTKDKFFIQDTFKCYYPFENVTHLREDPEEYVYFVENNLDGSESSFVKRHDTFKRIIKSQKDTINTYKETINDLDNDKQEAEEKAANDYTQKVNRVREVLLVTGQNKYSEDEENGEERDN